MHAQWLSCLRLFVTAWSVACQAPLSMGFSRQEYWSGITWGIYRKVVVDAEAVMVAADPEGEEFVRVDGTKVQGKEIDPYEYTGPMEPAYRIHRKNCFSGRER